MANDDAALDAPRDDDETLDAPRDDDETLDAPRDDDAPRLPREASEDEIRWLVEAVVDERVWTILDVPAHLVGAVFLPLAFGAVRGWPRDLLKGVMIFGVAGHHHALGMSINGLPVFTELSVWRLDDFVKAMLAAREVMQAQKAALDNALRVTSDETTSDEATEAQRFADGHVYGRIDDAR